jgi:hypothetical protein
MKLIPPSRAVSIIRIDSSSGVGAPKFIAPRHNDDTCTPVLPRLLKLIILSLLSLVTAGFIHMVCDHGMRGPRSELAVGRILGMPRLGGNLVGMICQVGSYYMVGGETRIDLLYWGYGSIQECVFN